MALTTPPKHRVWSFEQGFDHSLVCQSIPESGTSTPYYDAEEKIQLEPAMMLPSKDPVLDTELKEPLFNERYLSSEEDLSQLDPESSDFDSNSLDTSSDDGFRFEDVEIMEAYTRPVKDSNGFDIAITIAIVSPGRPRIVDVPASLTSSPTSIKSITDMIPSRASSLAKTPSLHISPPETPAPDAPALDTLSLDIPSLETPPPKLSHPSTPSPETPPSAPLRDAPTPPASTQPISTESTSTQPTSTPRPPHARLRAVRSNFASRLSATSFASLSTPSPSSSPRTSDSDRSFFLDNSETSSLRSFSTTITAERPQTPRSGSISSIASRAEKQARPRVGRGFSLAKFLLGGSDEKVHTLRDEGSGGSRLRRDSGSTTQASPKMVPRGGGERAASIKLPPFPEEAEGRKKQTERERERVKREAEEQKKREKQKRRGSWLLG